jgi:hypothetical protein
MLSKGVVESLRMALSASRRPPARRVEDAPREVQPRDASPPDQVET